MRRKFKSPCYKLARSLLSLSTMSRARSVARIYVTIAAAIAVAAALLPGTAQSWTDHTGFPSSYASDLFLSKFIPMMNKGESCYSNLNEPFFCRKLWHAKATSHEPYISRNATKQLHDLNELFVSPT